MNSIRIIFVLALLCLMSVFAVEIEPCTKSKVGEGCKVADDCCTNLCVENSCSVWFGP